MMNSEPMSRILGAKTVFGTQPAPRVSAFSSKGPNALTPEILKVIFSSLENDEIEISWILNNLAIFI